MSILVYDNYCLETGPEFWLLTFNRLGLEFGPDIDSSLKGLI